MEEIHGHIERITFQNPDNGFTVARLQEEGKQDLTLLVGAMPTVQVGETVQCRGQWKNDLNYGMQFLVKEYTIEQPSSVYGIQRYLGSGLIKGIGHVFAERIVTYLGKETLDVIDRQPEILLEIAGIGDKRLDSIRQCWEEQKAIREVMVFLQGYAISPSFAQKVFKTYGNGSIAAITENPYQLARDIRGIGFKTADLMARKMGLALDAPERIDAGVEHVLSQLADKGHTCYPVDDFLEVAQQLLEVELNQVAARLDAIHKEERIVIGPLALPGADAVPQTKACVWLKALHVCEQGIARELGRLRHGRAQWAVGGAETALKWAEQMLGMQLAAQQMEAVLCSLREKTTIITGGPGTGKSTIVKALLLMAHQHTTGIRLAAPTGRAAKRLSELTQMPAATIHSLLEFDFAIHGFRRNAENPLDCHLLIVDEASMIDTVLMYNLLKAVPAHARLVLVGDVDQLPSVGPGNVLHDLIEGRRIPVVRLTEIFRQAEQSKIVVNAHLINKGQMPDLRVQADSDFFFLEQDDAEAIPAAIAQLVQQRLPKRYGFDPLADIQVLSPMNRGAAGTRNLNALLQKQLNPSDNPLVKAGQVFHLKDKVMQLRNNYDKGTFNGDIGRLTRIDRIEHQVTVNFDGREVIYEFADLDQLTLAYAISIHKYQGSECPCVIIALHTTHYMMLSRNLLYTGLTRGKRLVVLLGSKKAIAISVKNENAQKRLTGLRAAVEG